MHAHRVIRLKFIQIVGVAKGLVVIDEPDNAIFQRLRGRMVDTQTEIHRLDPCTLSYGVYHVGAPACFRNFISIRVLHTVLLSPQVSLRMIDALPHPALGVGYSLIPLVSGHLAPQKLPLRWGLSQRDSKRVRQFCFSTQIVIWTISYRLLTRIFYYKGITCEHIALRMKGLFWRCPETNGTNEYVNLIGAYSCLLNHHCPPLI